MNGKRHEGRWAAVRGALQCYYISLPTGPRRLRGPVGSVKRGTHRVPPLQVCQLSRFSESTHFRFLRRDVALFVSTRAPDSQMISNSDNYRHFFRDRILTVVLYNQLKICSGVRQVTLTGFVTGISGGSLPSPRTTVRSTQEQPIITSHVSSSAHARKERSYFLLLLFPEEKYFVGYRLDYSTTHWPT